MKNILRLLIAFVFYATSLSAQTGWTLKAAFGGGAITEARAFSIGNYGYLGGPTADLWRYDPLTDIWTQMAAFPAQVRSSPVAFSIGNKGYLGTGGNFNDFYEYDPALNSWTPKANFGGSGREGAVGISISGKGYIGTGGSYLNDWWEYDTTSNAWTQKASLAGPGRYHAGAFSINGKGYISTGFNGSFLNDLWEYDPAGNSWTARTPMPGITRDRPVGLATASKGYILTGWDGGTALNDAFEYNPVTDSWVSILPIPTAGRYNACGFTINNKLYLGTGQIGGGGSDWWEFGPDCSSLATASATSCAGTCDGAAQVTFPDSSAVISYLWSNGAVTGIVQNLCAGTYTATVTDTSGCVSNLIVVVNDPIAITAMATINQPTCFGDSNGSMCAVANSSPVTYLWASGDTTSCLQNVAAGIYTVTITDSSGCSGIIPLVLTEPAPLALNFNSSNASCGTCANGSAAAQLTGGTLPATYLWSTGATLAFVNNLLPGMYSCCVTDANGCSICDSVEVSYAIGLIEETTMGLTLIPNPFSSQLILESIFNDVSYNRLRMCDFTGRVVYEELNLLSKKIIIPTEAMNPGIYFISVEGNFGRKYFKVMKQ